MRTQNVESSNVEKVGYKDGNLHVFFKNGCEVSYLGVPPDLYLDICEAKSVGSFMHRELKEKYSYVIIKPPTIETRLKNLEAFKDHVVNMWATDRPELIPDEIKHLFVKLDYEDTL